MSNSSTSSRTRRDDPSDTIDVEIEGLNAAGDGIARAGGQPLIVAFTIPGERVRVRPPRRRGEVAVALVEVLRASPHRIAAKCRHFGPDAVPGLGPCGGCSWQHIAYPEQLRLKTALVDRLVHAAVPHAPAARPMLPGTAGEPWGYRHKVQFVFGNAHKSDGRRRGATTLVMGHYVRGSRRIVPVVECPVHDERGNALAFLMADSYAGADVRAAGEGAGVLRSVAIRVAARPPEIAATLVVTGDGDKRLRTVTRRMLEQPGAPTSFHVNVHPDDDGFIFGRRTRRIAGSDRLREEVAATSFLISPTAFFQTNIHAAEILVRLVMEAVPPESDVLDLYAGAGLFALPLAKAGHRVTAVEENAAAVADGEASLRFNRIPASRCRFIARPVESALGGTRHADVVILDPPREGCSEDLLRAVFDHIRPQQAIYISCSPEALGRDVRQIAASGYRIVSMQPVDMFPHTPHVETVVVLRRADAGRRSRQAS